MNAIEVNRHSSAWQAFGQAVPRPRAILVVSAHWYINATAVTAMPRPHTLGLTCLHAEGTGRSPQPPAGLPADEANI